jgi:hypothetical protein
MTNSSDDGRNTNLGITNQTSSPAIFASAFATTPGSIGYAQSLSAFPTNSSPTQIAANGSGTIILDKTYNDNGIQKPILVYDLIGMLPGNLFPLTDQAEAPLYCSTNPSPKCQGGYTEYYADITMGQTEADGMTQSFQFSQEIAAYPEVDVTKQFMSIMSQFASDPDKLEKAINAFFSGQTKKFQKCTLDTYVAASTYIEQFAFAWANMLPSYKYWVFAVSEGTNLQAKGFHSIGTITFTRKSNAPNPADVSDRNGGYDIVYQPDDGGDSRSLSVVNGNLVTTANPDFPSISLLLSFALKSTFTRNPNDATVWPILAGKIDGFQVIAVGQDSTTQSSWYEFFHPQNAQQWMALIGSILGIAFAVAFLAEKIVQLVKWVRQRRREGRNPDKKEIDEQARLIDEDFEPRLTTRNRFFERSGFSSKIPRDYESFKTKALSLQESRIQINTDLQVNSYNKQLEAQRASLAEIAEIGVNQDVREAFGKLEEARGLLDSVKTYGDLKKAMGPLNEAVTGINESIASLAEDFSRDLGQEAVKQIKERERAVKEIQKEIRDRDRETNWEEDDRSPFEEEI